MPTRTHGCIVAHGGWRTPGLALIQESQRKQPTLVILTRTHGCIVTDSVGRALGFALIEEIQCKIPTPALLASFGRPKIILGVQKKCFGCPKKFARLKNLFGRLKLFDVNKNVGTKTLFFGRLPDL